MTYHSPGRNSIANARDLRERETHAEAMLWQALRGRQLAGLKFRRQHPIGPLVADFRCPDRRLIVELDAPVHAAQRDRDGDRDALLHTAGYHVIRFENDEVLGDLASVLERIAALAASLPERAPRYISRSDGW
jgi:very-short-patch-repair endonuclease